MEHFETLAEFSRQRNIPAAGASHGVAPYGVFTLESNGFGNIRPAPYCRRSFYKIALIRGENRCHYADRSVALTGSMLLFFSPAVPYTWEPLSDETGYFCIFQEEFYAEGMRGSLGQLPMFAPGGKPSYQLAAGQDGQVSQIFEKMRAEQASDYCLKADLARAYLTELLHFALKLEPTEVRYQHPNANARLTGVFIELVQRQFSTPAAQPVALKSARDFAGQLCVHVNHLNRAVRLTTGRTTTAHIFERVVGEAKSLLRFSSQNISEIGHRLGFEEPTHFYAFFRKQTGMSPSAFRHSRVEASLAALA